MECNKDGWMDGGPKALDIREVVVRYNLMPVRSALFQEERQNTEMLMVDMFPV
jgi:hypothetical protein